MKIKIKDSLQSLSPILQVNVNDKKWDEKLNAFRAISPDLDEFVFDYSREALNTGLFPTSCMSNDFSGLDEFKNMGFLFSVRRQYVKEFGYVALTDKFVSNLSSILVGHKVLEVGAGTGFLAHLLSKNGTDIFAIDKKITNNDYQLNHHYYEVFEDDAITHLQSAKQFYDSVIMSWPPYESSMAYEVLQAMYSGQQLIYIGESIGGCTGDDDFFDLLHKKATINQEKTSIVARDFLSFPSIHDRPVVYDIL